MLQPQLRGKPTVVLQNHGGCVIALSIEWKTGFFKYKTDCWLLQRLLVWANSWNVHSRKIFHRKYRPPPQEKLKYYRGGMQA